MGRLSRDSLASTVDSPTDLILEQDKLTFSLIEGATAYRFFEITNEENTGSVKPFTKNLFF